MCVQRDTEAALIYSVDATKKSFLLWKEIQGGRQIMQKYPQEIWMMEVDERELKDIDQPAESDCIAPRTGKYVIFQILKTSELF